MSLELSSSPSFLPLPHQICRAPPSHHHKQKSLTKIPSISKIRRFSPPPPPSRRKLCRSRLRSPLPPCFLTGSRTLSSQNSTIVGPLTRSGGIAMVGPPEASISLTSVTPPSDLFSVAVDLELQTLKLSFLPLHLPMFLPSMSFGPMDPNLHSYGLLFCQEFHKLLTIYSKRFLVEICWLVVWCFVCFVHALLYLYFVCVVFVCQGHLFLMLWITSWWFTILRLVCSIEVEKKKRIHFWGLDRGHPLAFWFLSRLEMVCVGINLKTVCWWYVWSQFFFAEELALMLCIYPCHLVERDPEILVSKVSPCVTCVTVFVYPMYQSSFLMPQSTDGLVSNSLGFLLVVMYYGFLPNFMVNEF